MKYFWHKCKFICGHQIFLEIVLICTFLSFSIHPGSTGDMMGACCILFLFNLLAGNYSIKSISVQHTILLSIIFLIILINFTVPGLYVHHSSLKYFIRFPGVIMVISHLTKIYSKKTHPFFIYACTISVIFAIIIQVIGCHFELGKGINGVYRNLHHLGLFACLTIPLLCYFTYIIKNRFRYLLILTMVIDFYLLWESSSRIAWFALFSGCCITFILFFNKKQIVALTAGLLLFSSLSLFISGFSDVKNRYQDFASSWRHEERIIIWGDTIKMLKDNSVKDWIIGHGLGSFRQYYSVNNFPHNFVLQILFENGLPVTLLFSCGVFLLLFNTQKKSLQIHDKTTYYLLITNFCICSILLFFSFFALPVYSRHTLCPAGFITGIYFSINNKKTLLSVPK